MNKLVTVILILITGSANGQTSIYHPFPDSNVVWNFHYFMNCFANGIGDQYYSITISGDTLINSQSYHKLSTPFVQSFSTGFCGGVDIGYKGAIRQDTLNRKVFFIPPSNNTEQLLYDFNMQVGDTVEGIIESLSSPKDTVQSIDSVLIDGSYRKRWIINSCYEINFIEGIGSIYGLFETSPGCINDLANFWITCFQQNEVTLYPNPSTNCELITSIKETFPKPIQATVSPNPFHYSALLQLNSNFEKADIIIYNAFGAQVRQQNIISQMTTLNRDELSNGIYFYQIINNNRRIHAGKFIID